jgi:hypothetical protein
LGDEVVGKRQSGCAVLGADGMFHIEDADEDGENLAKEARLVDLITSLSHKGRVGWMQSRCMMISLDSSQTWM